MMGQNPSFQGLAEVTSASTNMDSSRISMKALEIIDDVRVRFREYDCSEK